MAAVLAACSEDNVPDGPQEPVVPDGNGTPISFSGGIFAEDPSTRADFTDNGPVKITWTAGEDVVGIFGSTASGSIGDNVQYMAVPEPGNASACTFEAQGAELTWQAGGGTHTFYAYYPYVRMRNPDPQNASSEVPEAQTQEGATMSHVAASAFMVADKAELAESTGSVNLRFTHIYGVMQFVLDAETPMTLSSLTMTSAAADLAGMVTVDLSQPYDRCITAVSGGSRSVTLDFGAAGLALGDGTPKSAYMLVLPGSHPAGSISLTFQTADGGSFTKTIWKTADVAFEANVKSKQAIKPLTKADFAAELVFSVVSVTGGTGTTSPFSCGAPVINGADITIPLTTADASGKAAVPNGKVPVTVVCKVGSETSNRTLNFADVRDVQTFAVSGVSYKARLSYAPQLPNSGFEEPWSRDGNNKYDIMTFWGSGNFYTKFFNIIEVTNTGTTPATGVTPRSSDSAPFVESGKAANLKTNEIMTVAAAGSMFTGTMTAPTSIGDASATRKLTRMGMPFLASGKLLGVKADVKYKSGGNTKDGTYDMGSFVVELLKNIDESKPFEYHAYGTEGKGPGVDPNVTDDGYGSTARRAAFGAFYISDQAASFTIPYPNNPVTCTATVVPADTWTEIYIPITYPDGADADYDYFNISCSSSARGDQTQAAAGSSFTIDNIRLVYE